MKNVSSFVEIPANRDILVDSWGTQILVSVAIVLENSELASPRITGLSVKKTMRAARTATWNI